MRLIRWLCYSLKAIARYTETQKVSGCQQNTITMRSISVDTFAAATDGQRQTEELTTLEAYKKAVSRFDNVDFYIGRSDEYGPSWKSRRYDMIFLDANHTYDACFYDLHILWTLVRKGGVLVLHDYGHADFPGVKQAADEVFGPAPEGTTVVTLRWIEK